MLGEIPSPTFKEQQRVEFLQQLFTKSSLQNCSIDEKGNGMAILEGEEGMQNILLLAHADTLFSDKVDHTITLHSDGASGPGVADNSLGMAVLATLPYLVEKLDSPLKSNLILLSPTRGLGRGNLEGIRFFLEHNTLPITTGICVEGAQLGRLSFSSIGMLRGQITCSVPEEYDWTKFGATNAIVSLNEVINDILEIPIPTRPRSKIALGRIEGGTSVNSVPTEARLWLEIRSESAKIIESASRDIEAIIAEISSQSGASISWDILARRRPCGIPFQHPLVQNTKKIMEALDITAHMTPSTSELSAIIGGHIPGVTLGITRVENLNQEDEKVFFEPMYTGIAQLIAVLRAIDEGLCHED
jgi:di/tripeptidase